MGRIVEGIWDCKACGAKGIRASIKNCPNCGAVQESYYLPDGVMQNVGKRVQDTTNVTYVDKEKEEKARKGPDWYCEYCDTYNAADSQACSNCGAPKGAKNYFDRQKELKEREVRSSSYPQPGSVEQKSGYPSPSSEVNKMAETERNRKRKKDEVRKKALLFFAGTVLVGAIAFLALARFHHEEVVTGFSWEITSTVEEYKTVSEEGWNLPHGARERYSEKKVRTYEDVLDHYEEKKIEKSRQVIEKYEDVVTGYKDLGNGMYEEQTEKKPVYKTEYYTETVKEPVYRKRAVYDTYYYYDIDKWVYKTKETSKGSDQDPHAPSVVLKENERIGSTKETYKITTMDKDEKNHSYEFPLSTWKEIKEGDTIRFTTNAFGMVMGKPEVVGKNIFLNKASQ